MKIVHFSMAMLPLLLLAKPSLAEAPDVDFTVNSSGRFQGSTGLAEISGTYECTGNADYNSVDVNLHQTVGRKTTMHGYSSSYTQSPICDGSQHSWSYKVQVTPRNGKFAGGKARLNLWCSFCDYDSYGDCATGYTYSMQKTVQQRGGQNGSLRH